MAQIRIPVTAAADASWDRVFGGITTAARKARATIASESDAGGVALAKNVKKGAAAADAAYDKMVANLMSGGEKMMEPGTRAITEFVTETKSSFAQAKGSFDELARNAEKAMDRVEKAKDRVDKADKKGAQPFGKSDAPRAMRDVGRLGMRAARFGLSVMDDLAQGAGVDTSFASIAKKNNTNEDLAVALSNQSYIQGDARNGQRIDPKALMGQAQNVASKNGMETGQVLEGVNSFVALTGDLQTARDSMDGLAKLSKATGTDMQDMVKAAGNYSLALGDVPDKGQRIVEMMTRAAAEGKRGSLPIADMADKMAALSGAAVQYGGDVQRNTQLMIAMAQMTKMGGGAKTTAEQTSAVQGFTSTFGKGARLDAFKAQGVETHDAQGRILSPEDIILNAIKATSKDPKNQQQNMAKMFASVPAQRITNAAMLTYRNAGGGEAGLEAVKKQMEDLANATLDEKEVTESFNAAMDTASSKANVFNIEMEKTTAQLQAELTPALIALAPYIVSAASSLAKFISVLTGTPIADPGDDAGRAADKLAYKLDAATASGTEITPEQKTAAQASIEQAQAALENEKAIAAKSKAATADKGSQQDEVAHFADTFTFGANPFSGMLEKDRDEAAHDKANVDQLAKKIEHLTAAMTSGGIDVHVKSLPGGSVVVDPSARTPASLPTHK